MKQIILANIGNRNLTYRGETLLPNNRQAEPQPSFRERTRQLLADYETVQASLNEQILSVLLADVGPDTIEKVVLFASNNQIPGDRTDQDTVFEARILQRLFADRLNLTVEVVEYTDNVTHNDALLRFYRDVLRPYQTAPATVLICDAGGTPQQKSALKIAAEYLLDADKFSVRYVLPTGKITTVEQVEYRRIIDEEQVAALVEHGQYAGAAAIYGQLPNHDPNIAALLSFADLRSRGLWDDAQRQVTASLKELSPFLKQFAVGSPSGDYSLFKAYFPKQKHFFPICERFELARNSLRLGDYSGAVLNFQIFQESFLNRFIASFGVYDLVGSYPRSAKKLVADLIEEQSAIVTFFGGTLETGVPLSIKYAQSLCSPESPVYALLAWFEKSNSITNGTRKGTDALRNEIAHKGKGVDKALLDKTFPAFGQMIQEIGAALRVPITDSFADISLLITGLLRQ